MHYRTRRTELRPPTPDDLAYLHYLMSHPAVGPHVRFRGTAIDPTSMGPHLYSGVLAMHLVIGRRSQTPLGLVMLHDANELDGYARLSAVADPQVVGSGLVVEACFAFLRHAFDTWPLRKVYLDATESTLPRYASVLKRFGQVEGVLRAHAFAEGRFQDLTIIAIHRDPFLIACLDRFARLLEPAHP